MGKVALEDSFRFGDATGGSFSPTELPNQPSGGPRLGLLLGPPDQLRLVWRKTKLPELSTTFEKNGITPYVW